MLNWLFYEKIQQYVVFFSSLLILPWRYAITVGAVFAFIYLLCELMLFVRYDN